MKNVLIVEDNPGTASAVQSMVEEAGGYRVLKVASSLADAMNSDLRCIDIALLDIVLPDGNSFDLLAHLPADVHKIFLTTHTGFAIQAIKGRALDYLLKPVIREELYMALDKTRNALPLPPQHYYTNASRNERLTIKTKDTMEVVRMSDILYCKAQGAYTSLFLTERRILATGPLTDYLDRLPDRFIRTHHSYIANLDAVVRFNRQGFLVLTNGLEVPVSKRRTADVLQRL